MICFRFPRVKTFASWCSCKYIIIRYIDFSIRCSESIAYIANMSINNNNTSCNRRYLFILLYIRINCNTHECNIIIQLCPLTRPVLQVLQGNSSEWWMCNVLGFFSQLDCKLTYLSISTGGFFQSMIADKIL